MTNVNWDIICYIVEKIKDISLLETETDKMPIKISMEL